MLVCAQRGELWSYEVGRLSNVDAEPRVGKVALAVHLGDSDVGVPVRHRPFCRVGLVLDVRQSVGGWQDEWRTLAIDIEARIVHPRSPRVVDGLFAGRECWGQGDDRADVQLAVRPPVLPAPDAGHHGVVNGGVTERAGDSETRDVIRGVDLGLHPDNRVHLEKGDGRGRALEVDLVQNTWWKSVCIHLEADLERRGRVDRFLDDVVQVKRVGPELLVAKRLEAKNLPPVGNRL